MSELLATVRYSAEYGDKAAIQKKITEKLQWDLLTTVNARYNKCIYDGYSLKADAALEQKLFKLETEQTIKKMTELYKKVERSMKEWEGKVEKSQMKGSEN